MDEIIKDKVRTGLRAAMAGIVQKGREQRAAQPSSTGLSAAHNQVLDGTAPEDGAKAPAKGKKGKGTVVRVRKSQITALAFAADSGATPGANYDPPTQHGMIKSQTHARPASSASVASLASSRQPTKQGTASGARRLPAKASYLAT